MRAFLLLLAFAYTVTAQLRVESVFPEGADVPLNARILIRYCCAVAGERISARVQGPNGTAIPGQTRDGGLSLIFVADSAWAPRTTYSITVEAGARRLYASTFTTGTQLEAAPFRVAGSVPASGQASAVLTSPFRLRFSHPVNPFTIRASPRVYFEGREVGTPGWNFTSSSDLSANTSGVSLLQVGAYEIAFEDPDLEDMFGRKLGTTGFRSRFDTYFDAPTGVTRLRRSIPEAGETAVPTNNFIYLEFDYPIAYADGMFTLVAMSGAAPPIRLQPNEYSASRTFILRPFEAMRPDQEYTLRAEPLVDAFGRSLPSRDLLSFHTASGPDQRRPVIISQTPQWVHRVERVQWRFNVPVNTLQLPLFGRIDVTPNVLIPLRVHSDGLGVEADIVGPGNYALGGGNFVDRVQFQPFSTSQWNGIGVSEVRPTRVPSLRAVLPENEATSPPNLAVVALFDGPLESATPDNLRLTLDGRTIPVEVFATGDPALLNFQPRERLTPDAIYRAELTGLRNLAGNPIPDFAWTFAVRAPNPEPFRLLSTEPASGALNVSPRQAFIATFNRPPSLLNVLTFPDRLQIRQGAVPGVWRVEGNRLILEPSADLPAGRFTWSLANILDRTGSIVRSDGNLSGEAWIGGGHTDPGPSPRMIAMSPESRVTVTMGEAITIDFDQFLDRATINPLSLRVLADGEPLNYNVAYDVTLRRLTVQPSEYRLASSLSIEGTSELRGLHGAPAEPFQRSYPLRANSPGASIQPSFQPSFQGPALHSTVVSSTSSGSAIVLHFYAGVDPALVERHLQISMGERRVTGRFEWTPDYRAVTLYPTAPLTPGYGYVILPGLAWGLNNTAIHQFQVVAPQPLPGRLGPVVSSLDSFAVLPVDSQLDIRFDTDRPAGYIERAVARSGATEFPLTVEFRSPRRVLLRPSRPLAPAAYDLELRFQGAADPYYVLFRIGTHRTPVSGLPQFGPTLDTDDVPLDAQPWIKTQTLLNATTVEASLTTITGESKPVSLQVRGSLLTLAPIGLLRPSMTYTVRVTGWEDAAGRTLPPLAWTFQTGVATDLTLPTLVSFTPRNSASFDVVPVAVFDRPVALLASSGYLGADSVSDFNVTGSFSGRLRLSPDGRTVSVLADHGWPGATIEASSLLRSLSSLAGRQWVPSSTRTIFTIDVSGPSSTEAPRILQVSPPPDADSIPLGTRFRVRFSQEVLAQSLEKFRVEVDGQPIDVRRTLSADGRVVDLVPAALLRPETVYTVIAEGARSIAGLPLESTRTWNVRARAQDSSGFGFLTVQRINAASGIEFLIRASRPIDPVAFESERVQLTTRHPVAFTATLSTDGLFIRISSREPISAEASGSISVPNQFDYTGAQMNLSRLDPSSQGNIWLFDPGSAAPTPIRLQSVVPPDGTIAGVFPLIGAIYNREPFAGANPRARITNRGRSLPTRLSFDGRVAYVEPAFTFLPGETYTVEIDGILDGNGEALPAAQWSFSIRPDASPEPTLRLVSSTPAPGATNFAPNAPIIFEFNQPVLPRPTVATPLFVEGFATVPTETRFLGNRVEVRPSRPIPGGRNCYLALRVQAMNGSELASELGYSTAPVVDATPPDLESISPPPGTRLYSGLNTFLLRFSEPVRVPDQSIRWSLAPLSTSVSFPAGDGRSVLVYAQIGANNGPGESPALNLSADITDLSGNRLAAQSIPFSFYSSEESFRPRLVSTSPFVGEMDVPQDASVTLVFSHPMSEPSLQAGLTVIENGSRLPFRLSNDGDDGKTWRILPLAPWQAGASVSVTLAMSIYTRDGFLVSQDRLSGSSLFFTITAAAGSTPQQLTGLLVSQSTVDLRFSVPFDLASSADALRIRVGDRLVDVRAEQLASDWVRLIPPEPLATGGSLELTFNGETRQYPLRPVATVLRPQREAELRDEKPEVLKVGPGSYMLRFGEPIHPFSLTSAILMGASGSALPHKLLPSAGDSGTLLLQVLGDSAPARLRIGQHMLAIQ